MEGRSDRWLVHDWACTHCCLQPTQYTTNAALGLDRWCDVPDSGRSRRHRLGAGGEGVAASCWAVGSGPKELLLMGAATTRSCRMGGDGKRVFENARDAEVTMGLAPTPNGV